MAQFWGFVFFLAFTFVFLSDLGWDKWIIYPESFTFVQCSSCVQQQNQLVLNCRDDDPPALDPPSQVSPANRQKGTKRDKKPCIQNLPQVALNRKAGLSKGGKLKRIGDLGIFTQELGDPAGWSGCKQTVPVLAKKKSIRVKLFGFVHYKKKGKLELF